MKEIKGDLWKQTDADAICVTTNGFCKKDGSCVMGRGCAYQAKNMYPGIEYKLGDLIRKSGNHVHAIGKNYKVRENQIIFSFPVKHNFWEKASLSLIERSSVELVRVVEMTDFKKVVIPRMGCGCGKLDWKVVRNKVRKIFNDNFYIITY